MLTKDLLLFRTYREKITPKLIDPANQSFLDFAEQLISSFAENTGEVREVLEENTKSILETFQGSALIARGFEKLLLDRTEFDTEPNSEIHDFRNRIFASSSCFFNSSKEQIAEESPTINAYREQIAEQFEESSDELSRRLFSDLPAFQEVLTFKKISAEGLLHRYNCAQIQGLLLRSEGITLKLPKTGAAHLRQLLKYLRFHQLLVRFEKDPLNANTLILNIDGPLSLFVQTQKYGINLANIFPAILYQPKWELSAQIRIRKNQVHVLTLDQSCEIRSHYRKFLAYVPESIKLFTQQIEEKLPEWKWTPASDFISVSGEEQCFPDYWLKHSSGKRFALELFHAWHSGPLKNRLEQMKQKVDSNLILGINRSLLKDQQLASMLEESEYFSRFGFLFRESPTISKLKPVLENCLKQS